MYKSFVAENLRMAHFYKNSNSNSNITNYGKNMSSQENSIINEKHKKIKHVKSFSNSEISTIANSVFFYNRKTKKMTSKFASIIQKNIKNGTTTPFSIYD